MLISPDGQQTYVLYSISDAKSNATGGTPPYGSTRGIVVAHKGAEDAGFTNKYAVPSDGLSISGAIFPWGAIDRAGTVYVLYNSDKGDPGHFHTYYVWSKDKAATWSAPVRVDDAPAGVGAQIYATGDAGDPGVLDIAWYGHRGTGGADDNNALWDIWFAQVRNATSAKPTITRAQVAPKDPIHKGNICLNGLLCILGGDRSLADFMELQIGKDGYAQIAYADNTGFTSGAKGHVIWAKQVGGLPAYGKVASTPSTPTEPVVKPVTPPTTPVAGGGALATTGPGVLVPSVALGLLALLLVIRLTRRRVAL